MYNFDGEGVFAALPDVVAEEDDDEVVIGADETAEESHKLYG